MGGGGGHPLRKLRKKRRVGTKIAHLYTLYCTEVMSLCAPLAIEVHIDGDGEEKTAPVVVKLEGAEWGKEGGTAPAVTTTAPDKPAGLAGDACCKCGHQSSCKTTQCGCRVAGRNCVFCQCLVRCANVTPQNRQDMHRPKQGKHGEEEGQQRGKRRRGRLKGAAKHARVGETGKQVNAATKDNASGWRDAEAPPRLHRTEVTAPGRGDADATGIPAEGEGTSGDVPGTSRPRRT